jgi:hypothetical protein
MGSGFAESFEDDYLGCSRVSTYSYFGIKPWLSFAAGIH